MWVALAALVVVSLVLLSRLAVYRRDQPWNSGLNWQNKRQPRLTNPLIGGRLEVLLPSTYTARGQRLVPWLWLAQLGILALLARIVVS